MLSRAVRLGVAQGRASGPLPRLCGTTAHILRSARSAPSCFICGLQRRHERTLLVAQDRFKTPVQVFSFNACRCARMKLTHPFEDQYRLLPSYFSVAKIILETDTGGEGLAERVAVQAVPVKLIIVDDTLGFFVENLSRRDRSRCPRLARSALDSPHGPFKLLAGRDLFLSDAVGHFQITRRLPGHYPARRCYRK